MPPYLAYFWWGRTRRCRWVSRLSLVQALSITILLMTVVPFLVLGFLWFIAAIFSNPNIVFLAFLLAIFVSTYKK